MPKRGAAEGRAREQRERTEPSLGESLSFLRLLWEVNHALERTSKRMEARLGITAQQRMTLRMIGKFPGISSGELASLLHVDAGTASATLRKLEARRLLRRSKHRVDKRRVTLALTSAGRRLDVPSPGTVEAAVDAALESASEQEIDAVRRLLASMVEAMSPDDAEVRATERAALSADEAPGSARRARGSSARAR